MVKYVCSLGTLCHPARMMQRIHVKKVSFPFDWAFCDDKTIVDILQDDFKKFMDSSYYKDIANKYSDRTCGHSLYHEDMFFHKNPRNEEDYEYYKRCIERFKIMCKSPEEKLFIHMLAPEITNHPIQLTKMFKDGVDKQLIIENIKERGRYLNSELKNHTNNYKLLVIMNFGNNQEQSFEMEWEHDIHFLTLNTLSNSQGVTFTNNADNLYLSGIVCEHYRFH